MYPDRTPLTDVNVVAWMISGDLRAERRSQDREREHLLAFRETQRRERVGLIDRLRGIRRPTTVEMDLVCCPA
jgi:hypothetical protein